MKHGFALLLASSAICLAGGAFAGGAPVTAHAFVFEEATSAQADAARPILVDDDEEGEEDDDGGWFSSDDDEDDDDDCGEEDDDAGGCLPGGAGNPARAGTVTPPRNGLFTDGTAPKVISN